MGVRHLKGFSDVLIGLNYGDEGKGRIIDLIAPGYDVIARFNGGPNAGHTINVGEMSLALHLIPSAPFHKNILLYVGSGCVINLAKLVKERDEVKAAGAKSLEDRLVLSDQATVVQPHHVMLDKILGGEIGTTCNGIGPAYSERAERIAKTLLKNLQLGRVLDNPSLARQTMVDNYDELLRRFKDDKEVMDKLSGHGIFREVTEALESANELRKYVTRDTNWLAKKASAGAKVLFEGAQSTPLDVNKGTVPYVTSSHTFAGAAYVGGDLPPTFHRKTMGVAKLIMSRVGNGPFVSEFGGPASEDYCAKKNLDGTPFYSKEKENELYTAEELLRSDALFKIGIGLRMIGNEYGATTKRPRRLGMFDLVLLRHQIFANGVDELFLNKLDCLSDFSKTSLQGIPLVTGYLLNGERIDYVPGTTEAMTITKPIIEYCPHIPQIKNATKLEQLPSEALFLFRKISGYTGCKIRGVGIGPEREQFIMLP